MDQLFPGREELEQTLVPGQATDEPDHDIGGGDVDVQRCPGHRGRDLHTVGAPVTKDLDVRGRRDPVVHERPCDVPPDRHHDVGGPTGDRLGQPESAPAPPPCRLVAQSMHDVDTPDAAQPAGHAAEEAHLRSAPDADVGPVPTQKSDDREQRRGILPGGGVAADRHRHEDRPLCLGEAARPALVCGGVDDLPSGVPQRCELALEKAAGHDARRHAEERFRGCLSGQGSRHDLGQRPAHPTPLVGATHRLPAITREPARRLLLPEPEQL